MGNYNFRAKQMILGILVLVFADVLFLLLGAMLIERNVIGFDCANIWVLISLLVASGASASFSALLSGAPRNGYILAMIGILLLVFLPIAVFGIGISLASVIKNVVALFCGALIGNFFGMTAYHRVQNKRVRKNAWVR